MKILIFYRSREQTNSIASATKDALSRKQIFNLEVDFLNLDKRNYQKYLKQLGTLPSRVYLWDDEELVSDYIKDTYPSVEIVYYNKQSAVSYDHNHYGAISKQYNLVDYIIQSYKETFENTPVYKVNNDYSIKKIQISEFNLLNQTGQTIFKTKDLALAYIIDDIKQKINVFENCIEKAEQSIISYKNNIKSLKAKLKKYEA